MKIKLLLAGAMSLAMMSAAFADAASTISALPWYQVAEPYLLIAFGTLFSAFMGWGLTILQTHTNIKLSQAARDELQAAATNAAGRIIAAAEGPVANLKIDVGSAAIAAEVPKLAATASAALKTLGVTPASVGENLSNLIAGKIGVLQASAISAPAGNAVAAPLDVLPAAQK
jgi:hypothetical protein